MFEFLNDFVTFAKQNPESANRFYAVSDSDIAEAEERLGKIFPSQLLAFFREIGCGFLTSSTNRPEPDVKFYHVNRFLDPNEIADLILHEDPDVEPSGGFNVDEMPFFEVGLRNYLVIRLKGEHPYSVHRMSGRLVAPDIVTFVRELKQDPRFYLR